MKCLQNTQLMLMLLENGKFTWIFLDLDNRRRFSTELTKAVIRVAFVGGTGLFGTMTNIIVTAVLLICFVTTVTAHGPPRERDNEDIAMGRKMGPKWCSMAKVCNHDRIPICGVSHAGDVMGFRDLCDMFDYNCIRRRNYKQTACPEDKSILTVSRRPTSTYYDD